LETHNKWGKIRITSVRNKEENHKTELVKELNQTLEEYNTIMEKIFF
jgi:hypothetical protein